VNCANAVSIIRKREKRVKDFLNSLTEFAKPGSREREQISKLFGQEWTPGEVIPTIRNFTELSNLEKACLKADRLFSRNLQWGGLFQPGQKIHTTRPQSQANRQGKSIAHLSREASARAIRGLCLICGNLLFVAQYPSKTHLKCFNEHQRERGRARWYEPLTEKARRGRPPTVENIRKHYTWTIRHFLKGESLESIAKDSNVSKNAVVDGIGFIKNHLPEPEIVAARYRERLTLLRAKLI
jgi:hypothetical protein